MTPSVDERLASIVRALSGVVLPSLPPEAALAQEQVQLAIGHIQILRTQLDDSAAFEAAELADAVNLAQALSVCRGGPRTTASAAALEEARAKAENAAEPKTIRTARIALNAATASLITAISADGAADSRTLLPGRIIEHEKRRVPIDRRWFAAFGFDSAPAD